MVFRVLYFIILPVAFPHKFSVIVMDIQSTFKPSPALFLIKPFHFSPMVSQSVKQACLNLKDLFFPHSILPMIHTPFFCTEPQKITPFLKKLAYPKPQEPFGQFSCILIKLCGWFLSDFKCQFQPDFVGFSPHCSFWFLCNFIVLSSIKEKIPTRPSK